jgi:CRISPR type III-associated protein (TIGR04423 family)
MNEKNELSKIPSDCEYEGYIWMSNQKYPESDSSKLNEMLNIADTDNPFIMEGQLYCGSRQKSYSIKHVNGKHIVIGYDLNELNGKIKTEKWEKEEIFFLPNRITNATKLRFYQYWKPESDIFCENIDNKDEGMQVLIPSAFVFAGYKKNKEEML